MLECEEEIDNLKLEQTELSQAKIQLSIDVKMDKLDELESKLDRIQKKVEFKEIFGGSASKTDYTDMMKNYTKQISNLGATNTLIKEQQTAVKKNSEQWREYQAQIDANNNSIQELMNSIAEVSQQLANMPITKAETKNEKLDKKDSLYDAKINTTGSSSKKNSYINKQISNIDSRNKNNQDAYKTATSNVSATKGNLKKIYSKNKKSKYSKLFKKAYDAAKSGKKISDSLFNSIQNAITATAGDKSKEAENKQLQNLLRYCNDWNNRLIVQEEAEYNYKMSLATTASDRKEKWDTQRDNTIGSIEAAVSSATSGTQYTKNSKNNALSAQNSALKSQNDAYSSETKNAFTQINYKAKGSDAKSAYSSMTSALKKASGKYKKALQDAQKCIKSKKTIPNDVLEVIKKNNTNVYNKCALYNQDLVVYENAKYEEAVNYAATSAEIYANEMEKYENRISEEDKQDELAQTKAENQTTAKQKNKYVDQQIKNVNDRLGIYADAVSGTVSNYNKQKKSLSGKKTSSAKVSNASNKTWKKYKSHVENAKSAAKAGKEIDATTMTKLLEGVEKGAITNDFYKLCVDYNNSLQNKEQAEDNYELYQEIAKQEKADLAKQKFDNISGEYDNKTLANEQKKTELNNKISLAEAQGKTVDTAYYDGLIAAEESNQNILIQKRKALQDSLDEAVANGSIKEGSDEWYEMVQAINDTTNAIDEGTISIQEYANAIRQIEWDTFDKSLEGIKRINSEIDHYINLMSNKDMVDKDTGDFTEYGTATLGLRNKNYESYIAQAEAYQEEYNDLMDKIRKGEESLDDEEVISRLRELQDGHRDAMESAEGELQSIQDLVKQGYEAQIDALSELIDKYKELKDNELEAYNYQKSIAEKTRNIAALQKQLMSYGQNTDSEESRAQIQKLKVELQEAQDDLKDTQYEKFVSDAEDMLDELMDNYQEFIDEKLSDTNSLLTDIKSLLGDNSSIVNTLKNLDAFLSNDLEGIITGDKNVTKDNVGSITGFSTGGAISGLSGDNNIIRVANKERVLTPVQNELWEKWTEKLPQLVNMPDQLVQWNIQTPDYGYLMSNTPATSRNVDTSTTINVGDIVMNGVNDMETFGRQMREEILRNGKTTNCITEAVSAKQLGRNGVGNARLYK